MSDVIEQSWWRRVRYTPLLDLLRGRVSGRLDLQTRLASSSLPDPIQKLVGRVVRRTRLWQSEKIDVANELIAHFQDGGDAGMTTGQLIESFGDERTAAKLIRRAKERNRGWLWQATRAFGYFVGAVILVYLLLAVIFFSGSPAIRINYVQRLNQPFERVPPQDQGWPLYRDLLLTLDPNRSLSNISQDNWRMLAEAGPQSTRWPVLMNWLDTHPNELQQLRQAAIKPVLGFIYGPDGSYDDPQLYPGMEKQPPIETLVQVLLPHLRDHRDLANLLRADAALAVQRGETTRILDDINAICAMADQLKGPFLVNDLYALNIRRFALESAERALLETSPGLSDAQLRDLAHRLAGPETASDLVSFEGERMFIQDSLQRMYSDDGNGDGRMTPQGLRLFPRLSSPGTPAEVLDHTNAIINVVGPLTLAAMASRAEMAAQANRLYDVAQASLHRPLREVDWERNYDADIVRWAESPVLRFKYLPLVILMPSLGHAQAAAERYLGYRDGILVGIALEIYRREHGSYPQSLEALVPGPLPEVPIDRITGKPVSYRLIDGKPVIYSLGADRDDDGGQPPLDKLNQVKNHLAADWRSKPDKAPDGDWILFPQPREPHADE